MLRNEIIPCTINTNGVLIPSADNIVTNVELALDKGMKGDDISGRITWAGRTQAFITCDSTRRMIVSFTITNCGNDSHQTEESVRNIIRYLNS